MEREPQIEPVYHGFWPLFLIGISLLVIFTWEIWVGIDTRREARQLQEQQVRTVDQARQMQTSLEKLVRGLVDLSKTDDAAKQLVAKFGIKLNNPSVPTATSTPWHSYSVPRARRRLQIPRSLALATKSKKASAGFPHFCSPAWASAWLTFKPLS